MKTGDRVKVMYINPDLEGYNEYIHYLNTEGTIRRINIDDEYPIQVLLDCNSKTASFTEEELIVIKEENMNEEIERAIREGDMAMKLASQNKFENYSTVKCTTVDHTLINQIKKRTKKVGFVSSPLKSTM